MLSPYVYVSCGFFVFFMIILPISYCIISSRNDDLRTVKYAHIRKLYLKYEKFKDDCIKLNKLLEIKFNNKIIFNKLDALLPNEIINIILEYNKFKIYKINKSYSQIMEENNRYYDRLRAIFDMDDFWYNTSGTKEEKIKKFEKKFKVSKFYSQKMINFIIPHNSYLKLIV